MLQLRNLNSLPIRKHFNIDYFVGNNIQYYNVGEFCMQCFYCGAFGWKLENKGSVYNPHFGCLCCGKNEILLPPFPFLPDGLNEIFQTTLIMSPKQKNFKQYKAT